MSLYATNRAPGGGGGGVVVYPNFSSFPATAANGTLAVDGSTHILYEYNTTSAAWEPIASNTAYLDALASTGDARTIGALDAQPENANGLALVAGVLSAQSADATHPGMVNNTTQTFSGDKTFTGNIAAANLSGTNTGDVTLTAVGSTPNANGASLSGQALTIQPADATHPGVTTALTQTFGGNKTFAGIVNTNNSAQSGGLNTKAIGSGVYDGITITSSGSSSVLGLNIRDSGETFLYDGSNTLLHFMGGLGGTGPTSPFVRWDVNGPDSNTNQSLPGATAVIAAHNTSNTVGNFSTLGFMNSANTFTSAIEGVNDAQTANGDGHLSFLVCHSTVLTERFKIAADGTLTASLYAAGVALFDSSGVLSSGQVDLTSNVTGTLPVPNGGTGQVSLTPHGVVIGNGVGAANVTSSGIAGQVLISNGIGADPTFQTFGVYRAGSEGLSSATTTVTVAFSSNLPSTSYSVTATFYNSIDVNPLQQPITITSKTTSGFSLSWDTATDTSNYNIDWIVWSWK